MSSQLDQPNEPSRPAEPDRPVEQVEQGQAKPRGDEGLGVLSERDQQILDFERQWWKYAGAKEQAIRELFGVSSTRYYQLLNELIDQPDALAYDPMLVKRLRRMRSSRQRARSARRQSSKQ